MKNTHRPFLFDVTDEIITNAIQRDSGHCIIADAIRAAGGKRPMVDLQTIRWTDEEKGIRYVALTPAGAQRALLNWDKGIRPKHEFTIRIYPFQQVPSGKRSGKGQFTKKVKPGKTYVRSTGEQKGEVSMNRPPTVQGGSLPPLGALSNFAGKRRTFGLRLAGYVELTGSVEQPDEDVSGSESD